MTDNAKHSSRTTRLAFMKLNVGEFYEKLSVFS